MSEEEIERQLMQTDQKLRNLRRTSQNLRTAADGAEKKRSPLAAQKSSRIAKPQRVAASVQQSRVAGVR